MPVVFYHSVIHGFRRWAPITTTRSLTENIKQHISKTSKKTLKTANEPCPNLIITTVNRIFQCSCNAHTVLSQCSFNSDNVHSIHFKTGKSTTALTIRKFYVDRSGPSAIACSTCLSRLSKFVCTDDMFLLWVCQRAQIYSTLYKPKSTPKSSSKSWNEKHSADPANSKWKPQRKSYSLWNRHLIIFKKYLAPLITSPEIIIFCFNCILVISIKSTPLILQTAKERAESYRTWARQIKTCLLKVPLKRNFCMWDFCLVIKFQPYLETLHTFFRIR